MSNLSSTEHRAKLGLTPDSGSNKNQAVKRSADDDDDSAEDLNTSEPKKKIAFGLNKKESQNISQSKKPAANISIKLGATTKAAASSTAPLKPKIGKAALVFNQDDDDDEEMPPEAKMRMRNIGRDTPTSSGPNSFGKSRMGFCDSKKIYERKLKEIQDELEA